MADVIGAEVNQLDIPAGEEDNLSDHGFADVWDPIVSGYRAPVVNNLHTSLLHQAVRAIDFHRRCPTSAASISSVRLGSRALPWRLFTPAALNGRLMGGMYDHCSATEKRRDLRQPTII